MLKRLSFELKDSTGWCCILPGVAAPSPVWPPTISWLSWLMTAWRTWERSVQNSLVCIIRHTLRPSTSGRFATLRATCAEALALVPDALLQPSSFFLQFLPPVDSRASAGFVGLKNGGATCYMNSVIQQLYMSPGVPAAVLAVDSEQVLEERLVVYTMRWVCKQSHYVKILLVIHHGDTAFPVS